MAVLLTLLLAGYLSVKCGAGATAEPLGRPSAAISPLKRLGVRIAIASCLLAGAAAGGVPVAATVGGLMPQEAASPLAPPIAMGAATAAMLLAARAGIPAAPGEAILGAVAGAAAASGIVPAGILARIGTAWAAVPVATFFAVALLRKVAVAWLEIRLAAMPRRTAALWAVRIAAAGAGCFHAFALGMNAVASVAGPVSGTGFAGVRTSLMACAGFCALGALIGFGPHGPRGRLTSPAAQAYRPGGQPSATARVSLLDTGLIALVSGTTVVAASLAGIPIPWSWVAFAAVNAVAWAKGDRRAALSAGGPGAGLLGLLATPLFAFALAFSASKVSSGYVGAPDLILHGALLILSLTFSLAIPWFTGRDQSMSR